MSIDWSKKIGVLWSKTSKAGQKYLSGKIDDKKVLILLNKKRPGKNDPDWNVFPADEPQPQPEKREREAVMEQVFDGNDTKEDIPF